MPDIEVVKNPLLEAVGEGTEKVGQKKKGIPLNQQRIIFAIVSVIVLVLIVIGVFALMGSSNTSPTVSDSSVPGGSVPGPAPAPEPHGPNVQYIYHNIDKFKQCDSKYCKKCKKDEECGVGATCVDKSNVKINNIPYCNGCAHEKYCKCSDKVKHNPNLDYSFDDGPITNDTTSKLCIHNLDDSQIDKVIGDELCDTSKIRDVLRPYEYSGPGFGIGGPGVNLLDEFITGEEDNFIEYGPRLESLIDEEHPEQSATSSDFPYYYDTFETKPKSPTCCILEMSQYHCHHWIHLEKLCRMVVSILQNVNSEAIW